MRFLAKLIAWPIRLAIYGLLLIIRALLWIMSTRLFLLLPAAVFIIPLTQGQNVRADIFYPLFFGLIILHFIARYIISKIPRPKLPAPTLIVPKRPVPVATPIITPVSVPSPAPQTRAVTVQPDRKPEPVIPKQSFPPFSPVQQLLRPMRPEHSPSPEHAASRLPEAVRRILTP